MTYQINMFFRLGSLVCFVEASSIEEVAELLGGYFIQNPPEKYPATQILIEAEKFRGIQVSNKTKYLYTVSGVDILQDTLSDMWLVVTPKTTPPPG